MENKEKITFDGREIDLEWFGSSDYPKDIKISQVAGFCADEGGKILIIKNDRGWGFPGGHPEKGESPEEVLKREVWEEAYVTVKNYRLLGYVEVSDPQNESVEGKHYLQLRYAAQVDKVSDFKKEFESSERAFLPPEELPQYISWLSGPTGKAQYKAILDTFKK